MTVPVLANLIGGQFVTGSADRLLDVTNPANGELVGQVPALRAEDITALFNAAQAGAPAWRSVGPLARGRVLMTAASLIRHEAGELAELIVAEMGKTRSEAQGEVGKAAEFFEYYGGLARQPFGELLPDARVSTYAMQIREPIGIVVVITPWNDPLLTPARKLAPALLAGNAVVIKPASETPLITLRLAELLHRAGVPAGALGTATGRGSEIGDALVDDSRIAGVSFTGSTRVGLELQRRLAGRGVRVQTEMGGKNAAVVLADADLELAASVVVAGAFGQAGQRCTATSRLIVDRSIADEFAERVASAVRLLRVGPGGTDGVDLGPVVSRTAQTEICTRVDQGIAEGAEVIASAEIDDALLEHGAFVVPVLLKVGRENSLWREEVFGPVLGMIEVDGLDQAIVAVNDSGYGLSSAIFTTSLASANQFIEEVDTGQVSVNQPTSGWDIHQPFGGFKESGSAFKEQGADALNFYTRVKTVAVRSR